MSNEILRQAAIQGDVHQCQALILELGADANYRNIAGETPLHVAAVRDSVAVVELLLSYSANPDLQLYPAFGGYTALHFAVKEGHFKTVEALLRGNANPHLPDAQGLTALHHAAISGDSALVALLLTAGADPEQRCNMGKTAYDWANAFHQGEAASLLPARAPMTWQQRRQEIHRSVVVKDPPAKPKAKDSKKPKSKSAK